MGNTPRAYKGGVDLKSKQYRASEVRNDCTALCIAHLADSQISPYELTGLNRMLGDMMDDPERLGSALLTFTKMIGQLTDFRPGGFLLFADALIEQIPDKVATAAQQGKKDSIGLILGHIQDRSISDDCTSNVEAMIADIINSNSRMIGAITALIMMIEGISNARPGGFPFLCDALVDAIPERA